MKKKLTIFIIILLLAIAIITYLIFFSRKEYNFQTTKIERGEIVKTISTTGNLKYKKSIGVYSRVDGIVKKVYVDFNQYVKAKSLLAVIDNSILKLSLEEARHNLLKNSNSLEVAKKEYEDCSNLFESGFKSEKELSDAKYNFESADLSYKASLVEYEKAKLNYEYSFIYAPVNGMIVTKNIDEGTNVNTANPLFIIATEPSSLEIEALVDETEIGNVKVGQKVNFSVGAFPDRIFTGKVSQIRVEPQTIQNVVNYTVVISVENKEKRLLPGMTASVDIIVESKANIYKVPSTALRFQPTREMLKSLKGQRPKQTEQKREGIFPTKRNENVKILWLYDRKNNKITPLPVKTGISDGKYVEIEPLRNEDIEDKEVISYATTSKKQSTSSGPMFFGPPVPGRR
ncbi:MAG: efflux RND transporter periplasmic adaptor subunit [Brevinematia bacterium]